MKILRSLFILLSVVLFITACEKKDELKNVDTISGVLTAGENVSVEDLDGLKVFLGRFHNTVEFSSITFETTAIDSVAATTLNADGSFAFTGLTAGNYGLVLEDGFIISGDTALSIQLNGLEQQYINKNIERISQDNAPIGGYDKTPIITIKRDNLSSIYKLKKLYCYNDSKLVESYDDPQFSNNSIDDWVLSTILFAGNITFEFVFCTLDNAGNEIDELDPQSIACYSPSHNEAFSWPGDYIDINWVVEESPKYSWWRINIGTSYNGYYTLSDH